MTEKSLSEFISGLCKQRKVKMKDLATECFLSPSTLSRYTKGTKLVSPDDEANIANALSMTTAEREEFHSLINLTVQDGSLFSSLNVLDDIIFASKKATEENVKELDFVFYSKNRFLRNSSDIIEDILKHSEQEMYRCDIKVINCLDREFLGNLLSMLTHLLTSTDTVSVEHLLEFPKKNYLTCAKNLNAILPLLNFYEYEVYYSDNPYIPSNKTSFFNNVVIIETSWFEEQQNYQQFFVLSYLSGDLSRSIAFEDKYLFRFFLDNYQNLREHYKNALKTSKTVLDYTEVFMGMEMNIEQVVVKPNPCYHKIPVQVYESLIERVTPENKRQLQLDSQEGIKRMKHTLEMRYRYAHKAGNIDVFSKSGLLWFAKDGLLADHIDGLPPFDKSERKVIFQSLKEHMEKESEGYKLYIVQNDIDNFYMAFKNKCIVLDFPCGHSKTQHKKYPVVVIENRILAEIFFDYATNHIPAYRALPKEKAVSFLDELIEMMDK